MTPEEAAKSLGRRGGLKGGPARAAAMTLEERRFSARKAALARWSFRSLLEECLDLVDELDWPEKKERAIEVLTQIAAKGETKWLNAMLVGIMCELDADSEAKP
jgi:hypothetical protein